MTHYVTIWFMPFWFSSHRNLLIRLFPSMFHSLSLCDGRPRRAATAAVSLGRARFLNRADVKTIMRSTCFWVQSSDVTLTWFTWLSLTLTDPLHIVRTHKTRINQENTIWHPNLFKTLTGFYVRLLLSALCNLFPTSPLGYKTISVSLTAVSPLYVKSFM